MKFWLQVEKICSDPNNQLILCVTLACLFGAGFVLSRLAP